MKQSPPHLKQVKISRDPRKASQQFKRLFNKDLVAIVLDYQGSKNFYDGLCKYYKKDEDGNPGTEDSLCINGYQKAWFAYDKNSPTKVSLIAISNRGRYHYLYPSLPARLYK